MGSLISRQAAIDGMDAHYAKRINLNEWQEGWNAALDWVKDTYLDELPSAEPETATVITKCLIDDIARWYACGACGVSIGCKDRYCRNCGRKLKHE